MSETRHEIAVGDVAVGAGAVIGLIACVMPWFSFRTVSCYASSSACTTVESGGPNGFVGWGFLCLVAVLLTLAVFVLHNLLTEVPTPELPWPDWKIYIGLGAVMILAIVLDFVTTSQYTHESVIETGHFTRSEGWSIGIVLALVSALLIIAGGRLLRPQPDSV